jgi:hypothetical protein
MIGLDGAQSEKSTTLLTLDGETTGLLDRERMCKKLEFGKFLCRRKLA